MRTIILIALISMFTGCATYTPRFDTDIGVVRWHKAKNLNEVAELCNQHVKDPTVIYGCYRMDDDNKVCNVYTIDDEKYMWVLGHELKHCFEGRYHDRFGDPTKPYDLPKGAKNE